MATIEDTIYAGQVLVIPVPGSSPPPVANPTTAPGNDEKLGRSRPHLPEREERDEQQRNETRDRANHQPQSATTTGDRERLRIGVTASRGTA